MEEPCRSVTRTDVYVTTQIGYARVSKADGSQIHDLQLDALVAVGVDPDHIYEDAASGRRDTRPGLDACLKALRRGTRWWCGSLIDWAAIYAISSTWSAT